MSNVISKQELTDYLTRLITEKGRDVEADLNREGHIGLCYQNLIEFIEGNCSESERSAIYHTLTMIDFKNGDVFHYLDHLVSGMLATIGMD